MPPSRRRAAPLIPCVLALLLCASPAAAQTALYGACLENAHEVLEGALEQLEALSRRRVRPDGSGGGGTSGPVLRADQFPSWTDPGTGLYLGSKVDTWTSGFLAGVYYRMFALTGDARWAALGAAELPGLAPAAAKTDRHRLSHIFDASYGEALAAAGPPGQADNAERDRQVLQQAAASLMERYSPKVGAIQSWNDKDKGEFEVIIDSMASLKLLWEAAALPGGRPEWAAAALRHARTVAAGLFRPNRSTYHVALYDRSTGKLERQYTHQGAADNSTWARGQAWAVLGFTHAANATGDPQLLATAQRAADAFLQRLAEADDGVPLWDFDLPADTKQPWKDTSAAAIAAAGLLRLERLAGGGGNGTYAAAGLGLLQALADGYLGWDAAEGQRVEALLREGSFNVPKGLHSTGLIWGDYYFLDALAQLSWGNGTAACLPA